MSVANGDAANQNEFNSSFMSRQEDTSTVGKIDLQDTDTVSGTQLTNIQREMNGQDSFMTDTPTVNGLRNRKPTWTTDNIGSANQGVKERVDSVQQQVESNILAIAQNQSDITALQATGSPWTKITIDFTDIQDASTSFDFTVFTLPPLGVIHLVRFGLTTEFLATGMTGLNLSFGPVGDEKLLVEDFDGLQTATLETWISNRFDFFGELSTSVDMILRAESVGADLSDLTQGSIDLYVNSTSLPA